MTLPHTVSLSRLTAAPLVSPNFEALISIRPQLLQNCEDLPPYLLLPEVERLLMAAPNRHAAIIFNLLWQTGARINELLALNFDDIELLRGHDDGMMITLRTLKQRTGNNQKPQRGRPKRGLKREVGVWCPKLRHEIIEYKRTFKRSNDKPLLVNPQTKQPWSAQMVRNWFKEAASMLDQQGQALPIDVSPHVLRHSYAIHLLLHHVDINTIKENLGHRSLKSTEVYTSIWKSERYYNLRNVPFRSTLITS